MSTIMELFSLFVIMNFLFLMDLKQISNKLFIFAIILNIFLLTTPIYLDYNLYEDSVVVKLDDNGQAIEHSKTWVVTTNKTIQLPLTFDFPMNIYQEYKLENEQNVEVAHEYRATLKIIDPLAFVNGNQIAKNYTGNALSQINAILLESIIFFNATHQSINNLVLPHQSTIITRESIKNQLQAFLQEYLPHKHMELVNLE